MELQFSSYTLCCTDGLTEWCFHKFQWCELEMVCGDSQLLCWLFQRGLGGQWITILDNNQANPHKFAYSDFMALSFFLNFEWWSWNIPYFLHVYTCIIIQIRDALFSRRSKQPRNGNDHPTPLTATRMKKEVLY